MDLATLIPGLGLRVTSGPSHVFLTDLRDDSRRVTPGCAFLARTGAGGGDGRRFIPAALEGGAAAVITHADPPGDLPEHVAWVQPASGVALDQRFAGRLADRFFGSPGQKLRLVGVTGTNGKTTTTYLIKHLLDRAGVPCGLIGTVAIDDGETVADNDLTTPGAIEIARILARMVAHGCRAAALEVSSHALEQGRTDGLAFGAAVFTNLTGDHLDAHGTMEAYAAAKARLFAGLGPAATAIISAGDPWAHAMTAALPAGLEALTCRVADPDEPVDAVAVARVERLSAAASRARFVGPWGEVTAEIPLVGRYNVANALQALAAAHAVAGPLPDLAGALATLPAVPGRLEPVPASAADVPDVPEGVPTVRVDYAHTHDALENVLRALKPVTPGRLIAVVGCGGDRDRSKRPKMARVACDWADAVWITSDNPRHEDPQRIIDDMLPGIPADRTGDTTVEPDRTAAIRAAIHAAGPDDTVLIAGKGHETYQDVAGVKRHFDDREQALAALQAHPAAADADHAAFFWTAGQFARLLGGCWVGAAADLAAPLAGLSTDTRALQPGQVFLALTGERFDGHAFLDQAAERGAALAIVSRVPAGAPPLPLLEVGDTLEALQALADRWRDVLGERGCRVIAVAGSNGKTTTRHLIHSVLTAGEHPLVGTQAPGNHNNHIGVPLTLLAADPAHDFVAVEIGTNHPGEVAALAALARPDVGILTSIGREHLEHFGSVDEVAREEASLLSFLRPGGTALLATQAMAHVEPHLALPERSCLVTFGESREADFRLAAARATARGIDAEIIRRDAAGGPIVCQLALPGRTTALAATAAAAVASLLGVSDAEIVRRLAQARAVPGRLEVIELGEQVTVIHDAYNANPESAQAALEALADRPGRRRIAVLGDMLELGQAGPAAHRELGQQLADMNGRIDLAVFVGTLSMFAAEAVARQWPPERLLACGTWRDDLPAGLAELVQPGDTVLLKASRGLALERIIPALEAKYPASGGASG
ncbi:MAG: UDP-N-acetylmuramoyl-L-alanyl-D-glutamate--2,6-diaminopimelate ligase [Phycisphaeraceae bacterium]